jgi:adenine-specific DNA-methyltransferase
VISGRSVSGGNSMTMTSKVENSREKVRRLLRELFQFGTQDLDFGIYRILNFRRKEIERFIDEDLIKAVEAEFKEYAKVGMVELQKEVERLKADIIRDFGEGTIDEHGRVIKHEDAPKIKDYLKRVEELKGVEISEAQMNEVFNRVYEFLSRYYDKGDFISKRRYGGKEKYYVPYSGEEVVLYWANKDQYYVKTAEFFRNYHFKAGGYRVNFLIREAEVEVNNVVGENKYFVLCGLDFVKVDEEQKIVDVYFEYRVLTDEEKRKFGTRNVQEALVKEAIDRIFSEISGSPASAELKVKVDEERTVLERHLNIYVERNTTDYFIHKNLKAFFERELEFYIKNEVVDLDELENLDEKSLHVVKAKVKAIRGISRKIIEFLSQIEDFQKMLFEKKKFIIGMEYVITLDKIKEYAGEQFLEEIVEEILKSTGQLDEWKELLGLEVKSKNDLIEKQTFQGKKWKKLPLDTRHSDPEFKARLIEKLSEKNDLDEILNGILIKSENWQALNLLQEKYSEAIKCIYIDPPFNSKTTEILYKNDYKHSSWLSLIENRVAKSKAMLQKDGCYIIAIDENEQERLGIALELMFPDKEKTCVSIVHNPGGIQGENFSYCHEYAYFIYPKIRKYISTRKREDVPPTPLRDWGKETAKREAAKNCFYPIYVKNGQIFGFGEVCPDEYHPGKSNIFRQDGIVEIYPIDQNSVERKWRFSRQSVEAIKDELICRKIKNEFVILREKTDYRWKTVWTGSRYNSNVYGTKLLNDIMGSALFSFPKSLYIVLDCISATTQNVPNALIVDYFAGSGTTAHAIMVLNQNDGGSRKFILVEMADYFDTVLLPRIKKICYAQNWKEGKPLDRDGCSGFFNYCYVEQYEDTLNNIVFREKDKTIQETLESFQDYFLRYMLDYETRDSSTRLNIEQFHTPFDYKIWVTSGSEKKLVAVDLVETFNYLLGINVEKHRIFNDNDLEYCAVFGKKKDENIVIIWRNSKTIDLKRDKEFIENTILAGTKPDRIFINGDTLVEKAEPIEPEFKRLMGA